MTVEELFKQGNGTLTLEQFNEIADKNKVNFADISGYVSKEKYDNDVTEKEKRINELNDTISARDTDLASLKEQLSKATAKGSQCINAHKNSVILSLKSAKQKKNRRLQKL